jgi:hypothetical protein
MPVSFETGDIFATAGISGFAHGCNCAGAMGVIYHIKTGHPLGWINAFGAGLARAVFLGCGEGESLGCCPPEEGSGENVVFPVVD